MSRDPLEGYRPNDSFGPSVSPGPPAPLVPFTPAGPVSPGRPRPRSGAKTFALVFAGALVAIFVGAVAYFLSIPHTPMVPIAQPSGNAQPSENDQRSGKTEPTGETPVKQRAVPADAPSTTPTAAPK